MPRRRQKNTVLPKAFAIAVGVVFVAVVIAAQFGVFKAIKREFGPANVVLVTPAEAPKEKEKPQPKKEKKSEPVRKAAGSKGKTAKANHPRMSAPTVVTAGNSNGEGTGGATVEQGTGLKPGELPTTIAKPSAGSKPETTTTPTPKVTAPQPAAAQPKPEVKSEPKPNPAPAKFVDAEPVDQPQPTIPDDLLSEDLSKDYIAEAHIGPDGVPTSVKTIQSTGIDELDKVALDAARKWRFTPATLGGVPTDQTVHIKIQFRVQ